MMVLKEPLHSSKQLSSLGLEPTLEAGLHGLQGEFSLVFGQQIHQVAASFPKQNGNHRIDLDITGFEQLVHLPFHVPKRFDQAPSIPRKFPPVANDFGRMKLAFTKPTSKEWRSTGNHSCPFSVQGDS